MRSGVCAVALVFVAALPAGGAAATGTPRERPPVKLWSEFPLVPRAQPAPGGVAGARSETKRAEPAGALPPAELPALPSDDSAVPGTLVLAFLVGDALFLGGVAVLLIRARTRGPVAADAARAGSARPRSAPGERAPAVADRASRPREAVLVANPGPDRGEICEIAFRPGGVSSRFLARPAGGPASPGLPLAVSPPFALGPRGSLDESEDARSALDELVRALTAAGWEPFAAGEQWFERRFRRI